MLRKLEVSDARCLIMWPEGTRGYDQEEAAIMYLIMIANTIGYGRLPQLAEQIRELWYDPAKRTEFEQARQEYLRIMNSLAQPGINDCGRTLTPR